MAHYRETISRVNQPGYKLEVEALEYLKKSYPEEAWQILNGKMTWDIISENYAIDVVGTDVIGKRLHTDNKDYHLHLLVAKIKDWLPYLMFKDESEWYFVLMTLYFKNNYNYKKIKIIKLRRLKQKHIGYLWEIPKELILDRLPII